MVQRCVKASDGMRQVHRKSSTETDNMTWKLLGFVGMLR